MSNMQLFSIVTFLVAIAVSTASPALNTTEDGYKADCTINSYAEAAAVTARCKTISVASFAVNDGKTLKLALQSGSTLSFDGTLSFAYAEWDGPLIWISGNAITVKGGSNHLIDGRGEKWWDGKGDHSSRKKPQLMLIQATGGSVLRDIKVRNCPHTCIGISDSHDVTLQNWNINSKDGDTQGGANTDGFDIAKSYNVVIKNSVVWNQDDCICVNQGQHLLFDNIQCTGGHGLSIAVGIWDPYDLNTVYNVTFQNSVVQNSLNGIHVKTIASTTRKGEITAVTYRNIKLSGISNYAVNVQQDYTNDGSTKHPLGNIKIKQLTLSNIYGTMNGPNSEKVYILCGANGCENWKWSGINVSGARKPNSCNFTPSGFAC